MSLYKKNVFLIANLALCVLALHQPHIHAAGGLEDLSAFFDELLGGEGDNSFMNMLKDEEASKRSAPSGKKSLPTTEMPTPAQRAEFSKLTAALLSALHSLIKTTHPHHASWGGAVYESIKQHRNSLTMLESTLLHLQSIRSYLPKKELALFVASLKKYSKDILDLIAAANAIPAAKPTTTADEDAFLLGKTATLPGRQTPQNLKRRTNAFVNLAKKIDPLTTELQKLMQDPEFKKIFPAAPKPVDYKPRASSSRSSSYIPPRSSSKKSSRDSWDDDYRSPYSSDYSGYDDYGSYGGGSDSSHDAAGPTKTADAAKPQEPTGGVMAPPPKETKDLPHEGFAQHVKALQEDELVASLQQCLAGGSMLSNPAYFSTLARVFEQLFADQKDGGLSKLAAQLKQLEKELAETEQTLAGTKKDPKKPLPTGIMPNSEEAKEFAEKEKKSHAALIEAQNDYRELKQAIATAITRLLHLPTQRRVKESGAAAGPEDSGIRLAWMLPEHSSSSDDEEGAQKKHLGMNISRNEIDQQDVLCRHGRQVFAHFLDVLSKKFGMAEYLKIQETELNKEINQLEDQRRQKADALAASLHTTPLEAKNTDLLRTKLEQLTALAHELQYEKPTTATNDVHFYQIKKMRALSKETLTQEQKAELESGLGTSRYHVVNNLAALEHVLQTSNLLPDELEQLKKALSAAKTTWVGYITQHKPSTLKPAASPDAAEPLPPMMPLEAIDDADETAGDDDVPPSLAELMPAAKPPKQKPIFQGISQDQLQSMLGAMAQQPKPKAKAR